MQEFKYRYHNALHGIVLGFKTKKKKLVKGVEANKEILLI